MKPMTFDGSLDEQHGHPAAPKSSQALKQSKEEDVEKTDLGEDFIILSSDRERSSYEDLTAIDEESWYRPSAPMLMGSKVHGSKSYANSLEQGPKTKGLEGSFHGNAAQSGISELEIGRAKKGEIELTCPLAANKKGYIGNRLDDDRRTEKPWPIEKDGGLQVLVSLIGPLFNLRTLTSHRHDLEDSHFIFFALDTEKLKDSTKKSNGTEEKKVTISEIGFAKMGVDGLASYLSRGSRVEMEEQENVFQKLFSIADISWRYKQYMRHPWASSVSLSFDVMIWDPVKIVYNALELLEDGKTPKWLGRRRSFVIVGHSVKFDLRNIRDTKGSNAPTVDLMDDAHILGVIDSYEMAQWLHEYIDLEILKGIRNERGEFTPALNELMKACGVIWEGCQLHKPGNDAVFSLKVSFVLFEQYIRVREGSRISEITDLKLKLLKDLAIWKIPYETRRDLPNNKEWISAMFNFRERHGRDERFFAGDRMDLSRKHHNYPNSNDRRWRRCNRGNRGGQKHRVNPPLPQDSRTTGQIPNESPILNETPAGPRYFTPRNHPPRTATPTPMAIQSSEGSQRFRSNAHNWIQPRQMAVAGAGKSEYQNMPTIGASQRQFAESSTSNHHSLPPTETNIPSFEIQETASRVGMSRMEEAPTGRSAHRGGEDGSSRQGWRRHISSNHHHHQHRKTNTSNPHQKHRNNPPNA